MNSSASLSVKEESSALSGSRQLLLASDSIEFCLSENKIQSVSESKKVFTTIIASKTPFLNHQINVNANNFYKNSFNNLYTIANGNKENPVLNGNKGIPVISLDNDKTIVNRNKNNLIINGNKGNSIIFENTEKTLVNGSKEKLQNKEKLVNNNSDRIVEDSIPTPKTLLYSGSINVEWKQTHKIGAGLCNVGNTCFLNTVIQCLTYCPPLANYLLYDNDHTSKCTITGFCMMCILQRHMKRAMAKSGDIIKPDEVYSRLRSIAKHFQHGRQEDAHEFLRYVIDNLWKSCLSQNNGYIKLDPATKETTVINQIFGGYHRSQVTCLRCKGKSNTYDHFMDFILDIKQNVFSLEKALEKYIQPELLEQENSYKCLKCKMKVTAQKRFTVYKAPNVATFQLKRFDYNRSFGGKITKHITYPLKLNLRPYMSDSKGEPVYYQLNAVLVHSGPHCNSGHYYCYVKNSNGLWYVMDDQRVHQVNEGQVLNQIAYVLFYIKAPPTTDNSFKKSFENKNSIKKGNMPGCNFQTMSSIKLSPLTENNYATVKRKETISLSVAPEKKIEHSKYNHNPPVPLIEDSSGSSDENDKIIRSKTENSIQPSTKSIETTQNGSKKYPNWNGFSSFNIKRKLSNSALKLPSLNSDNSTPKVIATSVWTVTDAQEKSPNSNLDATSSNASSIADWQVTTNDTPILPKQKLKTDVANSKTSNGSIHSPSNQRTEITDAPSDSPLHKNPVENAPSNNKFCDFRKHETENCQDSQGGGEKQQKNSFLKRKCSDIDAEYTENSQFQRNQNQHSPLPKKIKYTLNDRNNDSNNETHIPELSNNKTIGSSLENSPFKKHLSNKNHLGEVNIFSSNQSKKENSTHSRCSSSNSSIEYEWVEKTKDNMNYKHPSPKRLSNHSSSRYYDNCNSKKEKDQSNNVVKELTKNSDSFYGSLVPMWKRFNRDIVNHDHKRRKSFNDFEDDYDKGKLRKYKPKRHYQSSKKNYFQQYADRNYNRARYESKQYYGHHNGKFFNSHNNRNRNSHHNSQSWKFSKNRYHS